MPHLMQMSLAEILALARQGLGGVVRRTIDEATRVRCLGVFEGKGLTPLLAIRLDAPRGSTGRRRVYVLAGEVRRHSRLYDEPPYYEIVIVPRHKVNWCNHQPGRWPGDDAPAFVRAKRMALARRSRELQP